jgi:hypothetical protein
MSAVSKDSENIMNDKQMIICLGKDSTFWHHVFIFIFYQRKVIVIDKIHKILAQTDIVIDNDKEITCMLCFLIVIL